jgi:murein DD-endopeptidase MepM/ murein hydrolase activator NlpD
MPRFSRTASAAVTAVLCLCLGLSAPADAQTARQKRDAARAKRAQLARELNTLRASDAQLDSALSTLNGQVEAQFAKAAAARQAVAAAASQVAKAEAQVKETEGRIVALRKAVVDRAVGAYIQPTGDELDDVASPSEAARRDALLAQVVAHDQDLIDQLRAAKEDQTVQREAAAQAKALADNRRKVVDARLAELARARADKARLAGAVDARIRLLDAEAAAAAANEASLTALISQREAARAGAFLPGPASAAGLIWPLRGRVTSEYGQRWGRLHAGIDIGAGTGTPIRAAKAGEVVFAGVMNGYGNCIVIAHGGGFSTLYAHQSRLGAGDGQDVDQGQVIGYVGSTGHSTGPHLHLETRVNGSPQNPRRFLP